MKVSHSFLISLFFLSTVFPQSSDTTITELRGMEDYNGDTHLFYRLNYTLGDNNSRSFSNSIYMFNIKNNVESPFLYSGGSYNQGVYQSSNVSDYEFWHKDPTKYIYSGTGCGIDCAGFINIYNSHAIYDRLFFFSTDFRVGLSSSNDSIIYSTGNEKIVKSTDFGRSWYITDSTDFLYLLSLSPYNDEELFAYNSNGYIYKSLDGGKTFSVVDSSLSSAYPNYPEFYYDTDSLHIYRVSYIFKNNTIISYLSVSPHNGVYGSWLKEYSDSSTFYISPNYSTSGTIYLADGKNILVSNNYGDTFPLFKSLDSTIVGIYKKPGSDKLYAATKYDIFEITPSTIKSIRHLNPFLTVLDYYPLNVGNIWIYSGESGCVTSGTPSGMVHTRKVISQVKKNNNRIYFEIKEDYYYDNISKYYFERVDSTTGKVFRYCVDSVQVGNEYLVEDLNAIYPDTVFSSRFEPWYSPYSVTDEHDTTFLQKNTRIKTYFTSGLEPWRYKLAKGFGLVFESIGDDFRCFSCTLKGAVINAIVYGDTTVTGMSNNANIPFKFTLNQNYPNPFNPSTTITYEIPKSGLVQLKIYDILGREIAVLVNEYQAAGKHTIAFDTQRNDIHLSSGIYFYRLKSGGYTFIRKMILLK